MRNINHKKELLRGLWLGIMNFSSQVPGTMQDLLDAATEMKMAKRVIRAQSRKIASSLAVEAKASTAKYQTFSWMILQKPRSTSRRP